MNTIMASYCINNGYLWVLRLRASVLQKTPEGTVTPSTRILLLPYRLIAIGIYYYYANACRQPSKVNEKIILGGRPLYPLQAQAVFDLTCE